MGITEGEETEKGTEEIFETIMMEKFPPINVRHQTSDPGGSENTKQCKCQKHLSRHIIFKLYA